MNNEAKLKEERDKIVKGLEERIEGLWNSKNVSTVPWWFQ